jgi:hypothetical protein
MQANKFISQRFSLLCVRLADVFVCVRNIVGKVCIIIVIVVVTLLFSQFLISGTFTFVPKVILTALSSNLWLQYFLIYLRYSKYSCGFLFLFEILVRAVCRLSCRLLCVFRSMFGVLWMCMSASFGCWYMPIVRPSFPLLLSRSGRYVVMLFSTSNSILHPHVHVTVIVADDFPPCGLPVAYYDSVVYWSFYEFCVSLSNRGG